VIVKVCSGTVIVEIVDFGDYWMDRRDGNNEIAEGSRQSFLPEVAGTGTNGKSLKIYEQPFWNSSISFYRVR
jgi:hypothetical protein